MKTLALLLVLMCCTFFSFSQGVFTNQTNGTLEKVIQDYPNSFKNLKGTGTVSTVQTSTGSEAISWHTELFKSEDFDDAARKFRDVYGQIKNTIIKIDGERPVIMNGRFESPSQSKKVNTVSFDLLPSTTSLSKLRTDLIMSRYGNEWIIHLKVHSY